MRMSEHKDGLLHPVRDEDCRYIVQNKEGDEH